MIANFKPSYIDTIIVDCFHISSVNNDNLPINIRNELKSIYGDRLDNQEFINELTNIQNLQPFDYVRTKNQLVAFYDKFGLKYEQFEIINQKYENMTISNIQLEILKSIYVNFDPNFWHTIISSKITIGDIYEIKKNILSGTNDVNKIIKNVIDSMLSLFTNEASEKLYYDENMQILTDNSTEIDENLHTYVFSEKGFKKTIERKIINMHANNEIYDCMHYLYDVAMFMKIYIEDLDEIEYAMINRFGNKTLVEDNIDSNSDENKNPTYEKLLPKNDQNDICLTINNFIEFLTEKNEQAIKEEKIESVFYNLNEYIISIIASKWENNFGKLIPVKNIIEAYKFKDFDMLENNKMVVSSCSSASTDIIDYNTINVDDSDSDEDN